jgi:hypothetical protein
MSSYARPYIDERFCRMSTRARVLPFVKLRPPAQDALPFGLQPIYYLKPKMASTLNWIVKDVESMIPSWNYASSVKTAPQIGDTAPASGLQLPEGQSTVILLTR